MSSNEGSAPSRPSQVQNKWILRPAGQEPHPNPKLRIICIPHAGSGAYVYHNWKNLPKDVEVRSFIHWIKNFSFIYYLSLFTAIHYRY